LKMVESLLPGDFDYATLVAPYEVDDV